MTRTPSLAVAAAVAMVAVLLVGVWLVLDGPRSAEAGNAVPDDVARTTVLTAPPDPSDGSTPPQPFPTVPSAQVQGQHLAPWGVRTAAEGRQLLVQLLETECSSEEAHLRGEHPDRVEVDLRTVVKPPPRNADIGPDGSYGCVGIGTADSPYAVIDLRIPLGDREVVIHRSP